MRDQERKKEVLQHGVVVDEEGVLDQEDDYHGQEDDYHDQSEDTVSWHEEVVGGEVAGVDSVLEADHHHVHHDLRSVVEVAFLEDFHTDQTWYNHRLHRSQKEEDGEGTNQVEVFWEVNLKAFRGQILVWMVDHVVVQDAVKGDGDAMDDGARTKQCDGRMVVVDDECCCSQLVLLPIH